jgi:hypothetical protein
LTGPSSGTTGGTKLHYTGTGTGTITTEGLGTFDGTISTGQVLDIDGACSDNANEFIDEPVISTGTIDLSSTGCGNAAALSGKATAGTDSLTVGSGGVLQTDNGAGNGGRTIHDDLVGKKGVWNVNVSTTYTADKKGLTNKKGTVNLASGVTLTDSGVTGSFFNNKKGAIAGSGELIVESPDTFNEGAGTITGATVLVNAANLEYTGTVHGAGTIETEGSTSLTAGAPSSGQTLEVLGYCSDNAVLAAPGSLTDNGAIVLSSTGCGNNSGFTVPAGDALTIGTTGTLTWPSGLGGAKTITGNLINDGTIGNSGINGLSVTGTLSLGSGGTFAPSINSSGSTDSIAAAGGGTLGGTLAPSGTSAADTYTILSGAFSGSFAHTNGYLVTVNPTNVTMTP